MRSDVLLGSILSIVCGMNVVGVCQVRVMGMKSAYGEKTAQLPVVWLLFCATRSPLKPFTYLATPQ
jgi:hypothetical protein